MKKPQERETGHLGMIAAVDPEAEAIIRSLKGRREKTLGGLVFYTGRLGQSKIACVVSGIGETNASHAATALISSYLPSRVINFGIGGAYPTSGLKPGDIAVATKEIYADVGVLLEEGFHPMKLINIPLLTVGRRRYFNDFPADRGLAEAMLRTVRSRGSRAKAGVFATVSACTGTKERATELSKRLGAICENMEGAAVAHVSCRYGIPFSEIRGISNIVEDRDTKKWNIPLASGNCQHALIEFIKGL